MSEKSGNLLRAPWQLLSRVIGRDEPPPGTASELGRLLWTDPRPLILPRKKMIVVFSPKSACTTVVIWFLHHLGHTKAARDYSNWPHRYRTEVYYKSALYRRSYDKDLESFSLVRIVRDPFERAVSSFRHVQRGKLVVRELARALGRRDIPKTGLSFSEFLDFLERCDLRTCDPHFRLQRHPIEERLPTRYLINASTENLLARLNEVEAGFGLPVTDFNQLEWLRRISNKHSHKAAPVIPADAYTHRFSKEDALSGSWPPYSAFLTPEARARLARLYAVDIAAYGDAAVSRSRPPKLELVRNSTPEPSA